MEILEAILKYFTDNSATLINIMLPILITFFITWFFRNKDKEDNDARNLRAELREYFLTNCKPIIDSMVDDTIDDQGKNIVRKGKKGRYFELKELHDYFEYYSEHIFNLTQVLSSLINFLGNISHKKYEKRFLSYKYMIDCITKLYAELLHPKTKDSQKLSDEQLKKINKLTDSIDLFFTESELMLFNYNFDNDDAIFQETIDELNKDILDTGLDNAKDFLFNREEMEKNSRIN